MSKKIIEQEKGIAGTDILIAIIIIVLFSSIIIGGMYNSFLTSAKNEYAAIATSYIIQFMEYVDKTNYDSVTVNNLESIRDKSSIDSAFDIDFAVEKYQDTHEGTQDLLKTVTITINYTLANQKETIEISKLKVKE